MTLEKRTNHKKTEYNKAEQEELFQKIREEYPEYTDDAKEMMKAGEDLKQLLSVLDSFY